jgi:transaldolase
MATFIDSAEEREVRLARELGWVKGVTTNPVLLAQVGMPPETTLQRLAAARVGLLFYQLVSQDEAAMLEEAQAAQNIVGDSLVLKVSPTEVGFRFVADHAPQFACCVTAVFSPAQALVAREAGARYVAVYVNRASRLMGDGLRLVKGIACMFPKGDTEIVAASIKSPEEAIAAAEAGAHHLAVPYDVLKALILHPLSSEAIENFQKEGLGIRGLPSKIIVRRM